MAMLPERSMMNAMSILLRNAGHSGFSGIVQSCCAIRVGASTINANVVATVKPARLALTSAIVNALPFCASIRSNGEPSSIEAFMMVTFFFGETLGFEQEESIMVETLRSWTQRAPRRPISR
jgi:hypothetical protein